MIDKVSVIGAGSLGTAIAQLVSNNAEKVYLYVKRIEVVEDILYTRRNLQYYPNTLLASNIEPKYKYEPDLHPDIIFFCVPSSAVRTVASEAKKMIGSDTILVSAAKGIEYPSGKTMSQIIYEETGKHPVILSGPNFASEIIMNKPTVTTIASKEPKVNEKVKNALTTEEFAVDTTSDVIGSEMCSILKNISAIAYGICEGMNLNENARFAVLNKAFLENKEIITKLGEIPAQLMVTADWGTWP
ncbi:hypothetical protein GCM10025861_21720 [Methanobacterium petrolearium]|nr:hypothetical protein GCM10025861_21720 [Methanobacterium petrolearium]